MRTARGFELRPNVQARRIAAAAALAAAAAGGGWPARSSAQAPSTSCAQIQSDPDRLACYDRAFPPAAPAAAKQAPPARSLPDAPPSADAADHVATERGPPRGARGSAVADAQAPNAPAAPGAAAAAIPAPRPAQADQADADVIPIVIVEVRDTPGRNAKVFTADNGSVWIQTDSVALNAPDTPFDAQIKKGVVGSFFLVPSNKGRAVRVRRAEN